MIWPIKLLYFSNKKMSSVSLKELFQQITVVDICPKKNNLFVHKYNDTLETALSVQIIF
jgi:hypothetical protein